MTEEIKEILEALKPHNDIKEYPLYLNRKQQDLLYDYITNLQQENERLKEDNLLIKSANKLVSDNLHIYKSRMDKATQLYLKELSEKGKVDDLACKMFNTLEENIK